MSPLVHEPDPLMAPVTRARILLVESDSVLRRYLAEQLQHGGYVVVDQTPADLTVLGFDHWGLAARTALGEVRRLQTEPVLVMAPQSTGVSRRAIIDAGAGDYAPKPVSVTELLARIQALLYRRSVQGDGAVVIQGNLLVDTGRRMVSIAGRDVDLTAAEYGLLKVLVANVGRTMGPVQLCRLALGPDQRLGLLNLPRLIQGLRHKLEVDHRQPRWIQTVPGRGFCFKQENER